LEKLLREKLENGRFDKVAPLRSRMMGAVKGKGNRSTELKFCFALCNAGISGWQRHEKLIGNPDILFPFYKVVIFLDGCFWHGCPLCGHIPKTNYSYWKTKIERNKERDQHKTAALKDLGYFVIRFWEHELHRDLTACMDAVKESLETHLMKIASTEELMLGLI
jgi:DNA mismatch endonuclease (patch repair protein)